MRYLGQYLYVIDYRFGVLALSINYIVVILLTCANRRVDI